MTREEYLAQLRALLTGRTPPDELERILAYYTEYFDEAGPQGEGRVIRELGTPAELVGRVLGAQRSRTVPAERDCPPEGAARERHGLGTLWKVLLAICAAPIAIPLILVVVAMVLGLVVLILALVAGVAVGGVVAIGAGVFTACAGFSVLFSAGLPTMMFFCGVGLLSSGVGLLLIAGSFLLAGLCFRGMAALLLDNEAESVSYQWATMEEILKNHVTPYGIVCTGYDAVTAAARYRVANGSSQWKALNDFAALHGGIAPYFDKTGALEVKKNRRAARVSIDAKTPVTALAYCDKRYGVIAEALVVDSKAGVKQSVKNEAFCARGGTSRRVFYVPARSGTQAMRYTGEYQIAKSKEGAETLRVTIAGRFTAAPGDIAAVSGTKIGIVGNFRVIECVRRFGESGEACEVTMQRE